MSGTSKYIFLAPFIKVQDARLKHKFSSACDVHNLKMIQAYTFSKYPALFYLHVLSAAEKNTSLTTSLVVSMYISVMAVIEFHSVSSKILQFFINQ